MLRVEVNNDLHDLADTSSCESPSLFLVVFYLNIPILLSERNKLYLAKEINFQLDNERNVIQMYYYSTARSLEVRQPKGQYLDNLVWVKEPSHFV